MGEEKRNITSFSFGRHPKRKGEKMYIKKLMVYNVIFSVDFRSKRHYLLSFTVQKTSRKQ